MVRIAGPGGFRMDFPIPRLPSWLGAADRLSANATTYPNIKLDVVMPITQATLAAGAIAQVIAIDAGLVPNFAARFGNLFREYCVVGARFELTLTNVANPSGLVLAFVDEVLATAPNSGSLFPPHIEIPLVSNPDGRLQTIDYAPKGYEDLVWTPTSVPVARAWLKLFAAAATTFTSATTSGNIIVRGTLALQFRGYANF